MEEEKETKEENIYDKLCEEVEKSIRNLLDNEGVTKENTETFGELVDIYKDLENVDYWKRKENIYMYGNYGNYGNNYGNYGNYGRGGSYGEYGRGSYGNYGEGSYGRRGRDSKYRGDDAMDRMAGEYGRYSENRSRYGASEETDKSFHYMVKALEDFIKVLYEEAETQQQKQMLAQTLQSSMQM